MALDRSATRRRHGRLLLGAAAVLLAATLVDGRSPPKPKVFLQKELPLSVVITTPVELMDAFAASAGVRLSGRSAITAVFSRPVIALGSDFGDSAAAKKVAFTTTCGVPGSFRWVTTTIARFDPHVDWPTDLACRLDWNTALATYDGAPLALGDVPPSASIVTDPLTGAITGVTSEAATNLTDGMWGASVDYTSGIPYEVPPDGKILTWFSYPVNLLLLKSALVVAEGADGSGPTAPVDVAPCVTPAPWVIAQAGATTTSSGQSLDVNTTCVEVTTLAPLKPNTPYVLRLPAGSRYAALAGLLQKDITAGLGGLLPFTIPLQASGGADAFSGGTSYRRFDLWLRHGLSADTTPALLAAQLRLCQYAAKGDTCTPVASTLALRSRGVARISVPALLPGTRYRLDVLASASVKDGYGQALQKSSLSFWTAYVNHAFASPAINDVLAVLDAAADGLDAWPIVTRSPPPLDPKAYYYGYTPTYPSRIDSWDVDLTSDNGKALLVHLFIRRYWSGLSLTKLLGAPASTVAVPPALRTAGGGADWTQLSVPLRTALAPSKARLVSACCDSNGGPYDAKLVLNSTLSFSVVSGGGKLVAWVLDSTGAGPVAGASVTVLGTSNGNYYMPGLGGTAPQPWTLAGQCTTDADGVCTIAVDPNVQSYSGFTAFAVADGGRAAVLPYVSFVAASYGWRPLYMASLVADRAVVVPGDSLKVTGFVQQVTSTGLQLPASSYAVLEVSPAWGTASSSSGAPSDVVRGRRRLQQAVSTSVAVGAAVAVGKPAPGYPGGGSSGASEPGPPPRVIVKLNGSVGTVHGEIPVPKDATLQPYTVILRLPTPGTWAANSDAQPSDEEIDTWQAAGSLSFTAADPRPPTAELQLEAPAWVRAGASVGLKATAVSYIGASVQGASVTIRWSLASSGAADVITLFTDAAGVATATLDLGALPADKRPQEQDTLSLDAEWIGPTRELITRAASVTIAPGPASLTLSTSLATDVPGIAFAVSAELTSNADGSELGGVPVSVSLRPLGADAACSDTPSRTTTTGAGFAASCQLALPCVGRFVLEACADVPGANPPFRACANDTLGRNASDWVAAPLRVHPQPALVADKPHYSAGETASLSFQNPWPSARLLLMWGNANGVLTKVVNTLPTGLASVALPLGNECVGSCSVTAVLDVPRLSAAQLPLPPPEQLAVSKLFDPRAPHTVPLYAYLDVRPNNALGLAVAVAAAAGGSSVTNVQGEEVVAVEPGAEAQITVTVTAAPGSAAPPSAPDGPVEVTVLAVDRSFLDLAPYPLPDLTQQMVLRLAASIAHSGMDAYRLAPGAVRAVFDKLMARLTGVDPWLPLDTTVVPGSAYWYYQYGYGNGAAAVDQNDTAYTASFASWLTLTPRYYYGPVYGNRGPEMVADGPAAAGSAGKGEVSLPGQRDPPTSEASGGANDQSTPPSPAADAAAVRLVTQFVVTPLFTTATPDANGRAVVTFKAPQNLGTFVVRAFAAAASAKYASAETKLVVRRRLSLTASVPRFTRVGDEFEAGVVVTVGAAPASVAVKVQVANAADSPLTLAGASAKTATFTATTGVQQEIRFKFSAAAMGSASLTFTASDGQGAQDALTVEIPVQGQQGDVWVATSFALQALPASPNASLIQWQEGLELPDAVPGSGGLSLTAGVGYLPSLIALYDNLQKNEVNWVYDDAERALLWATQPGVLSYYSQQPTPGQASRVESSFTELRGLTDESLGLLRTNYRQSYNWFPTTVDVWLNTWAVFLANQYAAAPAQPEGWASLAAEVVPVWRAAIERQVVADAEEARRVREDGTRGNYSDFYTLAWARLALGGDWVPSAAAPVVKDLSSATLVAKAKTVDRSTRVVISLVLLGMGAANPSPALVKSTVQEVTSALRVQGRTAYVAAYPGAASPASSDDQALALLLLLRSGATDQLLPKLAAYVANPTPSSRWDWFTLYPSWRAQGLVAAALSAYDVARGSAKPDVELSADANGLTVLEASFKAGNTAPVSNYTAWEDVPDAPPGSPSELSFEAVGSGEVTVAASLHFVPVRLLSFPTYRGIYVDAAVQLVDRLTGAASGKRVVGVPLGSVVALTVQVTSPDDLGPVTVAVRLPGGLEPLDPNLAGGVGLACGYNYVDSWSWGFMYPRWWWPMCPAQETRPSVVTFSYAGLSAGTSSVSVKAVAATVGSFVMPPISASANQQPEVMGMTAGSTFTVTDGGAPKYGTPAAAPRPCPSDCSGNGVCNLKTGKCQCRSGFTRSDCSALVA